MHIYIIYMHLLKIPVCPIMILSVACIPQAAPGFEPQRNSSKFFGNLLFLDFLRKTEMLGLKC